MRMQHRDPIGIPFEFQGDFFNDYRNPTKTKPPARLLVYGTPSGPALTQASWFRAEDKEAVKAAAEALKFSVIELLTDADKGLATGAHEGVLKGSRSHGRRLSVRGGLSADRGARPQGSKVPDPSKSKSAAR